MHAFPVMSWLAVSRFRPSRLLKIVCLALISMWVGSLSMANAATSTILIMGDSLSAAYGIDREAGWVSLLRERLGDDAEVVNASISGETTSGGVTRLPEQLAQHQPDIVVIELGGNDGLRGLPPQQMRANLSLMLEASLEANARVLLLGIQVPPNYGQAYSDAFRRIYDELANEYEVPLVPFLLEGIALDETLMQDDGIHPTAEAQARILDNVWPELQALLSSDSLNAPLDKGADMATQ